MYALIFRERRLLFFFLYYRNIYIFIYIYIFIDNAIFVGITIKIIRYIERKKDCWLARIRTRGTAGSYYIYKFCYITQTISSKVKTVMIVLV